MVSPLSAIKKPSFFANCLLCSDLHLLHLTILQLEIGLIMFIVVFSVHMITSEKENSAAEKNAHCNFFRRQGSNLRDLLIEDFPMLVTRYQTVLYQLHHHR